MVSDTTVARNLDDLGYLVQDDVRFLLHRGYFAGPEGPESLTTSPSGVLMSPAN